MSHLLMLLLALCVALTASSTLAQPPKAPSCEEQLEIAAPLLQHLRQERNNLEISVMSRSAALDKLTKELEKVKAELATLKREGKSAK